jgi:ferritin-like metal-binding protein YciE
MISEAEDDATRDAVIIGGAQKVEHYEIASYGTIRTWANLLGKTDVAALLEDTFEEEKEADRGCGSRPASVGAVRGDWGLGDWDSGTGD